MSESTVTSKGQITIPKAVRERLHLSEGDVVTFEVRDDGAVVLIPRNEPFEAIVGLFKSERRGRKTPPLSIDDMNPGSGSASSDS